MKATPVGGREPRGLCPKRDPRHDATHAGPRERAARAGINSAAAKVSAARPDPDAVAHLRAADPVMAALIDRIGELDVGARTRGRPSDPFGSLLRSVVGQQLSVVAARSIFARVVDLAGGRSPTPEQVLGFSDAQLRAAGLSGQKVVYVRDLAKHVQAGELDLEALRRMTDEEIAERITAVKGLGRWTAEMFLMFHLGRPDVLPLGDLGIRRAVERAYQQPDLPSAQHLLRIGDPWRPHRTLACLYLWESLGNVPVPTPA